MFDGTAEDKRNWFFHDNADDVDHPDDEDRLALSCLYVLRIDLWLLVLHLNLEPALMFTLQFHSKSPNKLKSTHSSAYLCAISKLKINRIYKPDPKFRISDVNLP